MMAAMHNGENVVCALLAARVMVDPRDAEGRFVADYADRKTIRIQEMLRSAVSRLRCKPHTNGPALRLS